MPKKRNYDNWTNQQFIDEIEVLRKQKTFGLVWEEDKTKEVFDYYINWDGEKTKEVFNESYEKFPILEDVTKNEIVTTRCDNFNLLIEGDNYHSLAVLNFTHRNLIDLIYIDPPYNTGNNDFKYNDRWVDREDSYRHSKWLSFMSKRLKLARNLLKPEGVIFISIDDNEVYQLKILCDEIFGESNFIANYIWESRSGKGATSKNVVNQHEYILCYARNSEKAKFKKDERIASGGNYQDEKGQYRREQLRQWGQGDRREDRPTMYYPLTSPDGHEVNPIREDGTDGRWRVSKDSMNKLILSGDVDFVFDGKKYSAYRKIREGKVTKTAIGTLLLGLGTASTGTIELKNIFKDKIFDTTKPLALIEYLIELIEPEVKEQTVLDFFAGSGTTGEAVLRLNEKNQVKRNFILCTNNEGKICENVCYPRLEKSIKGYSNSRGNHVQGRGGNLKHFKTSFVDAKHTDSNKKTIVNKSTEMICIKENAFEPIIVKKTYKIFKNSKINVGIIFDDEAISDFISEAKNIKGKFNIYVFSLDESVPKFEFKELKNRVKLCPIPEVILHVYRRIFK